MDDQEILRGIADNEPLKKALRTLLEAKLRDKIELDLTLSNELLGERIRAREIGLQKVDEAFKEIERYKTLPIRNSGANPAR